MRSATWSMQTRNNASEQQAPRITGLNERSIVGQFDLKLQRVPGAEALRCPRTRGIWGVEDSAPGTQFQIDPLPSVLSEVTTVRDRTRGGIRGTAL